MNRKAVGFGIVVAIEIFLLLAMPAQKYTALFYGRTVELRVAPVDPYSILSGYYVRLGYQISTPLGIEGFDPLPDGTEIYTVIVPGIDGASDAVRMELAPPILRGNEHMIKGQKAGGRIEYKIEEYFIAEESRGEVEQGLRDSANDRRAIVRLDKKGNPALHGLRIGDKRY